MSRTASVEPRQVPAIFEAPYRDRYRVSRTTMRAPVRCAFTAISVGNA